MARRTRRERSIATIASARIRASQSSAAVARRVAMLFLQVPFGKLRAHFGDADSR
jgi:hypothetical protein